MPKVLVVNHGQAAHGFYESAHPLDGGKPVIADEATFVAPGQSMVLHLPDEHLGPMHVAPSISVLKNPSDEDVKARGATISQHVLNMPGPADDGARAAAGANQRPAQAVAEGDGPGPAATVAGDAFDDLDDDQLRAHITTRDGKAPHHMLGRPKLLDLARNEPEAVG